MAGKTKSPRITASPGASSPLHWNVNDVPRLDKALALVCGVCGARGKYKVGTVTIDPTIARSPDPEDIKKAVGFTGYFRCRKCDAGGPWELPEETVTYIIMMASAAFFDVEDVPLVFGCASTFDKRVMRYATEGEAHLKQLIDREPERAFLWVRLGNLYSHADLNEQAEKAYNRALELDPKDIEARAMLGQLLVETDRYLEAVPHWHAVLKHARDARQVSKELRRNLVHKTIRFLLEAHAESNGQFDLLPTVDPAEMRRRDDDEPIVVELREFDLGTEKGINDLCDMFLEQPRRPR